MAYKETFRVDVTYGMLRLGSFCFHRYDFAYTYRPVQGTWNWMTHTSFGSKHRGADHPQPKVVLKP